MKYTIKHLIIFSLCCMLGFSSCSDSWLEKSPSQSAEGEAITATVDNMKLLVNGIAKIMVQQHHYYGQSFNGEGTMKLLYGEYPGQDFNFPYMSPGWSVIMNNASSQTQSTSTIYDAYPWYYYYLIIGNANTIIDRVDKTEGTKAEKDFLKAEALTFRAYAFFRLSQIYCDPWSRSNNGATDGIVLRIKEVAAAKQETEIPLSTLAQTYKRIYDDLDEAIRLYNSSGITREEMYSAAASQAPFPDVCVAHAIYARAALTREDYPTALSHAGSALDDHELMDVNTYRSGFREPNSEWIWGVYNDASETIWYYGWHLFMACNGYYAGQNINVCINRTLAESFPATDIRKSLFLTESAFLPEGKTFTQVIVQSAGNIGKFNTATADGKAAAAKAQAYTKKVVPAAVSPAYAYASLKFQSTGQPAVGCQPIIRASEMLLIQAEANQRLGNDIAAQDNLIALNKTSDRDESYTVTKTGDDLFAEIKKYRRLELWGEGFSWFDCKRWGDPVVRNSVAAGGNYHTAVAGSKGFTTAGVYDGTFWKWKIPNRETDYNTAIEIK